MLNDFCKKLEMFLVWVVLPVVAVCTLILMLEFVARILL